MSTKKHDWEISLIHDALRVKGCQIVDVYGYFSYEFGDPCFQMSRLVLSTGETIDVEGEHDMPYLCHEEGLMNYPERDGG